jgi:hypothetical protein
MVLRRGAPAPRGDKETAVHPRIKRSISLIVVFTGWTLIVGNSAGPPFARRAGAAQGPISITLDVDEASEDLSCIPHVAASAPFHRVFVGGNQRLLAEAICEDAGDCLQIIDMDMPENEGCSTDTSAGPDPDEQSPEKWWSRSSVYTCAGSGGATVRFRYRRAECQGLGGTFGVTVETAAGEVSIQNYTHEEIEEDEGC